MLLVNYSDSHNTNYTNCMVRISALCIYNTSPLLIEIGLPNIKLVLHHLMYEMSSNLG
jgi:hypothetical protein